MSKIGIIIQREYYSKVRKKSFIIMTLLGPILIAAVFALVAFLAMANQEERKVLVLDETPFFYEQIKDLDDLKFEYLKDMKLETAKTIAEENKYYALLHIPTGTEGNIDYIERNIVLYSNETPSISVQSYIEKRLEKEFENLKLKNNGVDAAILETAKTSIDIRLNDFSGGQKDKSITEKSMLIGGISGLLIYFFIFLYGVQVMKGVIEEKTNRIVEVIISSVKPFQLMMGKIIGSAMVGLTQFLLWVLLSSSFIFVIGMLFGVDQYDPATVAQRMDAAEAAQASSKMMELQSTMSSINFPLIIAMFAFYFIGGYLLYSALFAAIGSAVDNETDTQQFMLPITIPLILAIYSGFSVVENPDGPVAFWLSMIPLTSPITMMIRLPFGVESWQIILSIVLLILGFLGTTWFAARIYRVGILMYGKKPSYKELFKWLSYKN